MQRLLSHDRARDHKAAIRIALVYAAVGAAWILFSDRLAETLITHPTALSWVQTVKGWAFVLATSGLLYWLVYQSLRHLRRVERRRTISDRRRRHVEQELGETERALATLMSNLPGMAYRCRNDRDWTMEFVSDGCRELTGYPPDDLVANRRLSYADLIHPDDRESIWHNVQAALTERRPFQLTYRIATADGEEKWVWEQGRGIFSPGDSGNEAGRNSGDGDLVALEGFITDITERRELEQQLAQAQKMESIGRLAGGIAHDFNNLLTVINGYSEMLLLDLSESDPKRDEVAEIQKAGKAAASLTAQLLAFSRRQELKPRVLDLNEVIVGMEAMLRRLLGENVQLVTVLAEDVGPVRADPGQLQQVIMNLAVNGRDAMPQGGTVTIETTETELEAAFADTHVGTDPGPHVMLAVSDTGIGMDPETQARIFEPFYSTKEPGKGTGLGLSTVHGIVQQNGGSIYVYSTPGRGTTFKIYLPRVDETGVPLAPKPAASPARGGDETLLLVEDEEALQVLSQDVLERLGYRVLVANSGETALQLVASRDEPIDLLLTDVVMPDIAGPELARRVVETRPDIRVLYVSGYTDLGVRDRIRGGPGGHFLQKPFSPDSLARKVREVLDDGATGDRARPVSSDER